MRKEQHPWKLSAALPLPRATHWHCQTYQSALAGINRLEVQSWHLPRQQKEFSAFTILCQQRKAENQAGPTRSQGAWYTTCLEKSWVRSPSAISESSKRKYWNSFDWALQLHRESEFFSDRKTTYFFSVLNYHTEPHFPTYVRNAKIFSCFLSSGGQYLCSQGCQAMAKERTGLRSTRLSLDSGSLSSFFTEVNTIATALVSTPCLSLSNPHNVSEEQLS